MLKRFLFCLLLLFTLLTIPVGAELLPEENPIGETLVIEPDENIVIENLREDDETKPLPRVIDMTRKEYIARYIHPVLFWASISIVILLLAKLFVMMKKRLSQK